VDPVRRVIVLLIQLQINLHVRVSIGRMVPNGQAVAHLSCSFEAGKHHDFVWPCSKCTPALNGGS